MHPLVNRALLAAATVLVATSVFPKRAAGYDYALCISSCDAQYASCVERSKDVAYCSNQHDRCRSGCLRGPNG